jgi:hypothetical protein
MRPCKQKDRKRESDAGSGKNHRLQPATLFCNRFVKTGADARQKRGRRLSICRDVKPSIDGGEKGLFLCECGAAISAAGKVRSQITLWLGAAGSGFDQRVFIVLAWHRKFSANCFRA